MALSNCGRDGIDRVAVGSRDGVASIGSDGKVCRSVVPSKGHRLVGGHSRTLVTSYSDRLGL